MIYAGVDIGSVAAKAVLFNATNGAIIGHAVIPTGWNPRQAFDSALATAAAQAGVDIDDIHRITVTGYGRVTIKENVRILSEISCHAKGAHFLFPEATGIIDIGGQDCKAIRLGAGGLLGDFVMNDKCAAGTGRFIQMTATLLGMDLDTFFTMALAGQPVHISSMCAVFAESEIVGLLARSVTPEDIAAGVVRSVAERTAAMAARLSLSGGCVFTGGLGKSTAMSQALQKALGLEIATPALPQLTGALGAALP